MYLTVSSAQLRKLKKHPNSGQFTRTVVLTDAIRRAIIDGSLAIKKGQWVLDGATGERGQFIHVTSKGFNPLAKRQIGVRTYEPGHKFSEFQQSLAA